MIARAASRFAIPARWIAAVMQVESAGRANAVSPKGAMGLMQLMPGTWLDMRARCHLGADPFDPDDNIIAGTAYLKELFDTYGADGFLGAYNAGPGQFRKYLAGLRPLSGETQSYLAKLARLLPELPFKATFSASPSPSDWRSASLFASLSKSDTNPLPATANPARDGSITAQSFALAPQSSGLFPSATTAGPP